MSFIRNNNVLINTDTEAYLAAKKRLAVAREQKQKDLLLKDLHERVIHLEEQVRTLTTILEKKGIKNDIS